MKSVPWRYLCFLIFFPETILEHVQFPLQQGAVFIIQPFMFTWIYLAIHTLAVFKGHQEKWLHYILMTWYDMIDYALSRTKRHQTMTFCRRCKSPRQLGSLCLRWRHWDPIFGDWGKLSPVRVEESNSFIWRCWTCKKKLSICWSFHPSMFVSLISPRKADFKTETTMALYQAMRATPDHLPKERPKWKELPQVYDFGRICNIFLR